MEVEMAKKCTPLWREAHSQVKMYKTPASDHYWKLRCRKSARRCGAKHISKSKFRKHHIFGPLLEVEMLKKCMPLWCEAHFQVESVKNSGFCAFFAVQMWKRWTLTNLTNLTNLTDLTTLSQLTNKLTN